jgi:hypothetical protein
MVVTLKIITNHTNYVQLTIKAYNQFIEFSVPIHREKEVRLCRWICIDSSNNVFIFIHEPEFKEVIIDDNVKFMGWINGDIHQVYCIGHCDAEHQEINYFKTKEKFEWLS